MARSTPDASNLPKKWMRACLHRCAWLLAFVAGAGHTLDPDRPFAQFAHEHWTINEGLPFPGGNDLAEDRDGYLWIGSMLGLARLDGDRIVAFNTSTTPELGGNLIQGLATDSKGRIWIGTERGVTVYDDGVFERVRVLGTGSAKVMRADGETMLVTDLNTVFAVNQHFEIQRTYATPGVIAAGRRGDELWLATNDRTLFRYSGDDSTRYVLPAQGKGGVEGFLLTGDRLWARADDGLYFNDGEDWVRYEHPLLAGRVLSMLFDRDGNLWLGLEQTLLKLRHNEIVEAVDIGRYANAPRRLYEDRHGSVWMATHTSGIHRYWNGLVDVTPLNLPVNLGHYLWALAPWQGTIITGGTNGLAIEQDGMLNAIPGTTDLPVIYSLRGERDRLLIGTTRGVYQYHTDGRVEPFPGLKALSDTRVNAFHRDTRERLWLGTDRGLYRLDPNGAFRRLTGDGNDTRWGIRTFRQLKDGRLLAAGEAGLLQLLDDQVIPQGLPREGMLVLALHETADGHLLMGTLNSTTLFLQTSDGWHEFGPDRGVPLTEIYGFADDGNGAVLISGLRGAYVFTEQELATLVADPQARLNAQGILTLNRKYMPGQEVLCCLGGGDGRVLFDKDRFHVVFPQGVYSFAPHARQHTSSNTRIERLSTRLRPNITGHSLTQRGLRLAPAERDLQLDFSAASLMPLHSPQLAYRLHGYDQDWRRLAAHAQPVAHYTNLPPGNYRFEFIDEASATKSGRSELSFTLTPHLHETIEFRVLMALLAGVALVLLVRLNTRRLINHQRALESEVSARTDELRTAYERLEAVSRTDALTAIHNRRHAMEEMPARLRRMKFDADAGRVTDADQGTLVALLDIDHFKGINDTYGHQAGDQVLQEVARRLSAQKRHNDLLVRWGGEEFLLVAFCVSADQVATIATRVCAVVRDTPIIINERSLPVTASLGVVLVPSTREVLEASWDQMVHMADEALYQAKQDGRNCWREAPFVIR